MGSRASTKERCLPFVVSETSGDSLTLFVELGNTGLYQGSMDKRLCSSRDPGHLSSWALVCQALNLIVPAAAVCLGDDVNEGGALFQWAQSCWADTGPRVL